MLSRGILSQPSQAEVKNRLELVLTGWEKVKKQVPERASAIDDKLAYVTDFMEKMEELCTWLSTTRDLVETQNNLNSLAASPEEIQMVIDAAVSTSYLLIISSTSHSRLTLVSFIPP